MRRLPRSEAATWRTVDPRQQRMAHNEASRAGRTEKSQWKARRRRGHVLARRLGLSPLPSQPVCLLVPETASCHQLQQPTGSAASLRNAPPAELCGQRRVHRTASSASQFVQPVPSVIIMPPAARAGAARSARSRRACSELPLSGICPPQYPREDFPTEPRASEAPFWANRWLYSLSCAIRTHMPFLVSCVQYVKVQWILCESLSHL